MNEFTTTKFLSVLNSYLYLTMVNPVLLFLMLPLLLFFCIFRFFPQQVTLWTSGVALFVTGSGGNYQSSLILRNLMICFELPCRSTYTKFNPFCVEKTKKRQSEARGCARSDVDRISESWHQLLSSLQLSYIGDSPDRCQLGRNRPFLHTPFVR